MEILLVGMVVDMVVIPERKDAHEKPGEHKRLTRSRMAWREKRRGYRRDAGTKTTCVWEVSAIAGASGLSSL
jgi:hypothetical protein